VSYQCLDHGFIHNILNMSGSWNSVGDDEVMLCAKVEEPETIVITVSNSMFPNDVTPHSMVVSRPRIEIAKQKDLSQFRG